MVSGWVYARLVNDPQLQAIATAQGVELPNKVWEYAAPEGATGWQIIYQRIQASDVAGINVRLMAVLRYLIRVVDRGKDWDHETVANRIDALFDHVGPFPVADPPGTIEGAVRMEPFDQPETIGGVEYRHLGGIYQIAANAGS